MVCAVSAEIRVGHSNVGCCPDGQYVHHIVSHRTPRQNINMLSPQVRRVAASMDMITSEQGSHLPLPDRAVQERDLPM
jgi:hypothetical protein